MRTIKTVTIKYIIPYSAKAMVFLHKVERQYKAQWSVDTNEEITITVNQRHEAKVKELYNKLVERKEQQ